MANLAHPVPKTEAQINLAMRDDKQGKAFWLTSCRSSYK